VNSRPGHICSPFGDQSLQRLGSRRFALNFTPLTFTSIRTHAASSMLTTVSQQRRWPLLSARARFSMASQRFRATLAKSISWRSRIRRATLHLYRKSFVRRDTVLNLSTIAQASHCSCACSRDVKFPMESNPKSVDGHGQSHHPWTLVQRRMSAPRPAPEFAEAASRKLWPS
jgi:hypothetical protein